MKWGLFIMSIGCLMICLAGNPDSATSLGTVIAGGIVIVFGFLYILISGKLKKRREAKAMLEREEAEFLAEQARKKEEAGKKKERENVEKSRKNSNKE